MLPSRVPAAFYSTAASTAKHAVERRVLVSGAGLAGLACALRLKHRCGITPDIIEYRAENYTRRTFQNFGTLLLPPSYRLLKDIPGLEQGLSQITQPIHTAVLANSTGKSYGKADLKKAAEKHGLEPAAGVHWPALHDLLTSSLKSCGIDIQYGTTLRYVLARKPERKMYEVPAQCYFDLSGEDRSLTKPFKDRGFYEVVVAADGATSRIRTDLCGHHNQALFFSGGYGTYHAVIPRPSEVSPDLTVELLGDGRRLGLLPLANDRLYVYGACTNPVVEVPVQKRNAVFGYLFQNFQGYGAEHVVDILSNDLELNEQGRIKSGTALNFTMATSNKMPALVESCVVFVGDAGHMVLPHGHIGELLALEDAKVLADYLAEAEAPLDALEQFDDDRIKRVHRAFSATTNMKSYLQPMGLGSMLRDGMLSAFFSDSKFQKKVEKVIRDSVF